MLRFYSQKSQDFVFVTGVLESLPPGAVRPEFGSDHPSTSNTQVKNARIFTCTLPISLYVVIVEKEEQIYLYLIILFFKAVLDIYPYKYLLPLECKFPIFFSQIPLPVRSRDSAVGIATGNGLDEGPRSRSSSPGVVKNFLFSTSSRPALGSTQPPIQWVSGPLSPGAKRQGREADHSPPSSAEVKKIGSIHPLPLTASWRSA
jgi:hypothetical protein